MTTVVYIGEYLRQDLETNDYGCMTRALAACGEDGSLVLEGGGKKYDMGENSLMVPSGVSVTNPGLAGGSGVYNQSWFNSLGGILTHPDYPIYLHSRSGLNGVTIAPAGLEFPQVDANKWRGTGVAINTVENGERINEVDIKIENSLIMGYKIGLFARNCPRLELNKLMIDCVNGLTIDTAGDPVRLDRVHVWPFATVSALKENSTEPGLSLNRAGTAFEFVNNADAGTVSKCFSGHHAIGFRAANLNGLRFDNCSAEALYLDSATGYQFEGVAQNIELTACQGVGCQNGVVVNLQSKDHLVSINGGMYATNSVNNVRVFKGTVAVRNSNLGWKEVGSPPKTITTAHVAMITEESQVILQNNNYKSDVPLTVLLENASDDQVLNDLGNVAVNPFVRQKTRGCAHRRLTIWMSMAANTASKAAVNLLSRSRIRNQKGRWGRQGP